MQRKPHADALSRISVNALNSHHPTPINFQGLVLAQNGDPELSHLWSATDSLVLLVIPLPTADIILICDMSTDTLHPYVPEGL